MGQSLTGKNRKIYFFPRQNRKVTALWHDQKDPVLYVGIAPIQKTNQHDPLKPYLMDRRTFDFNRDGLANFGLIPDMLQDLHNVEMPKHDLQALFGSAEAYLEMWERVEQAK